MVDKSAQKIRSMFDSITPSYDLLNHLLSLNMDRGWRRRAIALALHDMPRPLAVLDLCTGTGDLLLGFGRHTNGRDLLVGCDFTPAMLEAAQRKQEDSNLKSATGLVCGDALRLPFADGAFDVITVGFGVRNFEDLDAGLKEMARVTRPGGRIVILECSNPQLPVWREIYSLYFTYILPRIGGLISGTDSYTYLRDSVREFFDRNVLKEKMEKCGLNNVGILSLAFGSVVIHTGEKF